MRRYADKGLQSAYELFRQLGADNFSTFYYGDGRGPYGPRKPHRGAGHRNAYWNGFLGVRNTHVRGSVAYVAWAAGWDNRMEHV